MQKPISRSKTFFLLLPTFLSSLLAIAHFFRERSDILVICSALIIPIILYKRPISLKISQVALVLFSLEWAHTTYKLIMSRIADAQDWQRLAIIMFTVIAFNLVAALLLTNKNLARHYSQDKEQT